MSENYYQGTPARSEEKNPWHDEDNYSLNRTRIHQGSILRKSLLVQVWELWKTVLHTLWTPDISRTNMPKVSLILICKTAIQGHDRGKYIQITCKTPIYSIILLTTITINYYEKLLKIRAICTQILGKRR